MVSKELVGSRIRQVRTRQRKTLKEVEAVSGFSSTHISEIERGRTSPTIGALIRIAHALDKDPSFFVEERELEEVCVTTSRDRAPVPAGLEITGQGMRVESLTRGILGGRLLALELILDPQGQALFARLPENGDLGLICTEGACEVVLPDGPVSMSRGDSLHLPMEEAHVAITGGGELTARMLILIDPKEAVY